MHTTVLERARTRLACRHAGDNVEPVAGPDQSLAVRAPVHWQTERATTRTAQRGGVDLGWHDLKNRAGRAALAEGTYQLDHSHSAQRIMEGKWQEGRPKRGRI